MLILHIATFDVDLPEDCLCVSLYLAKKLITMAAQMWTVSSQTEPLFFASSSAESPNPHRIVMIKFLVLLFREEQRVLLGFT